MPSAQDIVHYSSNHNNNVQKYFNHFSAYSKSMFSILKSTPYDDISWSNNWQKSKHRAFFIAPTIIKIKNIICEIETYARYLHVMCEWIFLNLLQIKWKIIVKIVLFYTIIYARWLDNTFIWPNYEGIWLKSTVNFVLIWQ